MTDETLALLGQEKRLTILEMTQATIVNNQDALAKQVQLLEQKVQMTLHELEQLRTKKEPGKQA